MMKKKLCGHFHRHSHYQTHADLKKGFKTIRQNAYCCLRQPTPTFHLQETGHQEQEQEQEETNAERQKDDKDELGGMHPPIVSKFCYSILELHKEKHVPR
jgi:hypothetical protein